MKRVLFSLVAVLALAGVVAMTAQAQEAYPSSGTTGATTQQPATQTPTSTTDQPATTTSDASTSTDSGMPATAGPLPLIGLGGLASLAAGAVLSRRRRKD